MSSPSGWISKTSDKKAEQKAIQDERTKRLKELALRDQVFAFFKYSSSDSFLVAEILLR